MKLDPFDTGPAFGPRHGRSAPRGQTLVAGSSGARFGQMFDLPKCDPGSAALAELVRFLGSYKQKDSATIPAGYTYLGQFVDHDITFDATSALERDNDPNALRNFRTPRFDLDSLYGGGPADQPFLYDWRAPGPPGARLLVGGDPPGTNAATVDLPRNVQGRALIGDGRNDENVVVSQLHLLFIHFHNNVVTNLVAGGSALTGSDLFEEAQRLVRWHYQWIVVHDFLETIAGRDMALAVLSPGVGDAPPTVVRKIFTFEGEPHIPVEFSAAAYRFGHSMVREDYTLNDHPESLLVRVFPDPNLDPPGSGRHLGGFRRLPRLLEIDWRRFFVPKPDADAPAPTTAAAAFSARVQPSMAIDPGLSTALFRLPPDDAKLAELNLERGLALKLPSGHTIAIAMRDKQAISEPLLSPDQMVRETGTVDPAARMTAAAVQAISNDPPLWYYILREAELRPNIGRRLGQVGGRIVAEVLVGLLEADPSSYLHQEPAWKPTLPRASDEDFTMIDLLNFTLGPP